VVFTAHYDTCARLPFPNFITPKNILIFLGYSLLISLPFLALMFGLTTLLAPRLGVAGGFLGMLIGFGTMFYVFFLGAANPHTVNDNTSGVAALMEIMAALPPDKRTDAAFIFFDNEEKGKAIKSRMLHLCGKYGIGSDFVEVVRYGKDSIYSTDGELFTFHLSEPYK
jgi:hypothetical protein